MLCICNSKPVYFLVYVVVHWCTVSCKIGGLTGITECPLCPLMSSIFIGCPLCPLNSQKRPICPLMSFKVKIRKQHKDFFLPKIFKLLQFSILWSLYVLVFVVI